MILGLAALVPLVLGASVPGERCVGPNAPPAPTGCLGGQDWAIVFDNSIATTRLHAALSASLHLFVGAFALSPSARPPKQPPPGGVEDKSGRFLVFF